MPGMPAVPKNSAHSDQPKAASTPSEISVSIVAAPWRRLVQAARWNGQAPQMTTGAARASAPTASRELQRRDHGRARATGSAQRQH